MASLPRRLPSLVGAFIALLVAWAVVPTGWAEDADQVIGTPAAMEESAASPLAETPAGSAQTVVLPVMGSYDQTAAKELLPLVNAAREAEGRSRLVWDEGLEAMALLRVAEASLLFDHDRPNGGYCFGAADEVGIVLHTAGENIAGGQKTAQAANRSFTESSGHYANMVKPAYRSFGAACFVGADGQVFWCEIFDSAEGSGTCAQVSVGIVQVPVEVEAVRLDRLSLEVEHDDPTYDGVFLRVRHKNLAWNRAFATFAPEAFDWEVAGVPGITASSAGVLSNPCLLGGDFTVTASLLSCGALWASVSLHAEAIFSDTGNAWYMTGGYVPYVYRVGLMTGYGDGLSFGPDDPVTRGQAATILYRMATGDAGGGGVSGTFVDVPSGAFYTAPVEWCYGHGIVTGDRLPDGASLRTFRPDDLVTREELATMLHRFASACGAGDGAASLSGFPDAGSVSGYAVEHLGWCVACGIVTGSAAYSPARLIPQGNATRAEAAKMITVLHRDVLGGWVPEVSVLAARVELEAEDIAPETAAEAGPEPETATPEGDGAPGDGAFVPDPDLGAGSGPDAPVAEGPKDEAADDDGSSDRLDDLDASRPEGGKEPPSEEPGSGGSSDAGPGSEPDDLPATESADGASAHDSDLPDDRRVSTDELENESESQGE